MHLLNVIASLDPVNGGPCQYIRNSVQELEKLNVSSEVLCLDDPDAPYLKEYPFAVHALGPGKTIWCYSFKLMPWLLENLCRFDVVIVNGLWLYTGKAVREAWKQLRLQQSSSKKGTYKVPKLFVMPHGMLDPYFQNVAGRRLKAIRNWIYWKIVERKLINEASGLLFTCEKECELARVPFRPYKPKQEVNVGLGIADPPIYNSGMRKAFLEKCPELETAPYILFLSRIHEKKGVDLLIKSYVAIASKLLSDRAMSTPEQAFACRRSSSHFHLPKLVIAGPGIETAYGESLKNLALRNKRLRNHILFPGMLSGDAKWGAFYGCEAFALPSHQENFGIAVVEALACGKPVLISNQVNIWKEVIEMGGGLVAEDSLEEMQNLVRNWITLSKGEKLKMGKYARKAYELNFAIGPATSRLLKAVNN